MSWGIVAGAGVALVGGMMQSDAAGDAAEGQQQASRESNALQRYMYDNNVALNAPVMNTGNAARDRLSYLLGLSPTGFAGSGTPKLTRDSLRQQLQGQYTRTGPAPGSAVFNADNLDPMTRMMYEARYRDGDPAERAAFEAQHMGVPTSVRDLSGANDGIHGDTLQYGQRQDQTTLDEAGLNAEIDRRLAEQDAQQRAAEEAARNDPNYGRLSQEFQFDTYTPEKYQQADPFSYTGEDLYKDPSYLFRLQQGQKALDRQGAAAGRFLSGRQLQASSDYNQGAASQEFQNAYSRALGTYGTNETNRFNTFSTNENNRFNAFNTNQNNRFNANQANFSNTVNPLLSLSGAGQVSAQFLGNAGQQTAQLIGNNLTNNANAQGAAGISQANSMANGLSNAYGGYQQNQLMNQLLNRNTSVNNNPGTTWGSNDTLFGSGGFFSGNRGSGD
jgi:hypothetical protein